MRLFIAVDVPKEVSDYLVDVQKKVGRVRSNINYVKHFHCTFKYLGDADVNKVREGLRKVKYSKFKVHLHKLGVFPDNGLPRVLWVGLSPWEDLQKLHTSIEYAIKNMEIKGFVPHITLGRVKFLKNKVMFKEYLETIKIAKLEFEVRSFKLYNSTLTPNGPVYEVIEEYELG
ncbi:RNA 2',3'-cyclic phosphodiesterase [Candidatus Woesearchaeota archaeon]|nr:RNA 2',3'-cyclic phosphodiesterase [Candidatus Woesearchaeota archaeon]